jgi:CHAT domain-containing protein/tetratricopeptide (TPR) repeat protein
VDVMDDAWAILAGLRDVPPQHATRATVDAYRRAIGLLADGQGSRPWLEAHAGLGSHLLETPDGDRASNVEEAAETYRRLLEFADREVEPRAWAAGTSGLANALVNHPAADASAFEEALALYDEVIASVRDQGNEDSLAVFLGMAAAALARMPSGDLDLNLERAIGLQEEAVRALADTGDPPIATRGRARHNLATLYVRRRTGVRSQNVDRAIRTLQAALVDRPADLDPVGRARTLRALAQVYPEWSGADSLDDAHELAEAAQQAADAIEQGDERAAARLTGWAYLEREQSALNVELDSLYQLDKAERAPWLEAAIAHHRAALEVIDHESMPLRRAEWMAGLGRLLGRYPSLGNWEHVEEADRAFADAMAAFDPGKHLLLARQILERWGEASHEIGRFEASFVAYADALMASDYLLAATADPRHRSAEIFQSRGYALFAAYAAARLGKAEDAVAIAERGRMRLHGDLLEARRALATAGEQRDAILESLDAVRSLEAELARLAESDPEREQERMRAKLADFLKVDPSLLQVRRTDPRVDDPSPVAVERDRVTTALGEARRRLSELLVQGRPADDPSAASAADVVELARASSSALVYLMTTVHGGAAVAALPDGSCDVLVLEDLTSDLSRGLLFGSDGVPAFADAALLDEVEHLPRSLDAIVAALAPTAMTPIIAWLHGHGVKRAVLIPLGSLGLLPLHVAADDSVVFSYAPSARALGLDYGGQPYRGPKRSGLVVFADPDTADAPALPFSVVEGRTVVTVPPPGRASLVVRGDVTLAQVAELTATAEDIHFGCHGTFRPSDPLESELLLAGEDRLTLADVFADRVDLSAARIVTLLACRSGNVEFRQTPDESLGFPSALLLGGVRGVVSTMWSVDDAAAALFSVRMYELLYRDGLPPAEAVARARAWLRAASGRELHDRLTELRSRLEPGDEEGDAALGALLAHPAFASEGAPYGAPDFWGPFIFTGRAGSASPVAAAAAVGAGETAG